MSKHFIQSALIRKLGLASLRTVTRAQIWRKGPRLFINSIPKAGTHLLTAELAKFRSLQNSYLHLDNRKFDSSSVNSDGSDQINVKPILADIQTVRRGQYFSGHVAYSSDLERVLGAQNIKTIFVTRDPRAVLVSRYNYILGLERHWLHDFLTNYSSDPIERYRVLVLGHKGSPSMRPMGDRLAAYCPWLLSDVTMPVSFEALVGARGGRSDELKRETLDKIMKFAGLNDFLPPHQDLAQGTVSATFRKGQADGWREELPSEIIQLVDDTCGPVIEEMGYKRTR